MTLLDYFLSFFFFACLVDNFLLISEIVLCLLSKNGWVHEALFYAMFSRESSQFITKTKSLSELYTPFWPLTLG